MPLGAVLEAVVACRDLAASVAFHTEAFGLDVLHREPDQALLGVHGAGVGGRLRLVAAPQPPAGLPEPRPWDLGPRLLGIYSRDLARTVGAIDAAGGRSRPPVTYPYGTAQLTECVALGTDGLWWTIPQAAQGHRPSPALESDPDRLHGELHSAVLVPADHDAAVEFFAAAGGLSVLFDGTMAGPPFDEMIGMPADAGLRLTFLMSQDQAPARLEIMSFTGVSPVDLCDHPLGLRRLVFGSDDPRATLAALVAAGGDRLDAVSVRGPAGVRIEVRPS